MEKEIVDGNKLIAEFMGFKKRTDLHTRGALFMQAPAPDGVTYSPCYIVDKADDPHDEFLELKYNSSWDWLMPVIEKITKIEDGKFSVDISSVGMWACFIKRDDVFEKNIVDYGGFTPIIMNAFKSVVGFIEWYNTKYKK